MQESNRKSLLLRLPVLPLRGMMVFPHMVLHFDVGRPKSVAALEKAMMGDQRIFLVAQMDAEIDEPELSDLCRVGTIAQIKQVLNLPGDSIRVLVEGVRRGVLGSVLEEDPCMMATVRLVREDAAPDTAEMKALVRTTHAFFEEYCNASMRVSQETLRSVMDVDKPDQLADIIAANVLTRLEDRQAILAAMERVGMQPTAFNADTALALAATHGAQAVMAALDRAATHDRKGGVSWAFVRSILEKPRQPKPKMRKVRETVYIGGEAVETVREVPYDQPVW